MYEDSVVDSDDLLFNNDGNVSSDSSPRSSNASSMDQYMRKLFFACDKDGDGYLDRYDLEEVSKQLGLEGDVSEILAQFGAGETGKIAYRDFLEFKAQFTTEMDRGGNVSSSESANETAEELTSQAGTNKRRSISEISPSARHEGARARPGQTNTRKEDAVMADKLTKATRMQKASSLSEYLDPQTLHRLESLQVITPAAAIGREQPKGTDFLEIANRLHIAALSSLKNEIYDLNSRLHHVTTERDNLRHQVNQTNAAKQKMQKDFEEKLQSQMMRVTELQSVIAELTRKLNQTNDNVIIEEEDDEGVEDGENSAETSDLEVEGSRGCSECSCDGCEHRVDGPNQLNLLATTNGIPEQEVIAIESIDDADQSNPVNDSFDLGVEVSRVLGQLESTVAERKKSSGDSVGQLKSGYEQQRVSNRTGSKPHDEGTNDLPTDSINNERRHHMHDNVDQLKSQIIDLERQKSNLEKQLQKASVSDYVSRRAVAPSASSSSPEVINTLRLERENLRVKLRKSEQELEDVKAVNLTIREEREKLRKKVRSLERRTSETSPVPTTPTQSSAQARYSSQGGSVDYSSTSSPSSSRKNSLQQIHAPQGNASFRTSASSPFVPVKSGGGSVAGSSPNSTLRRSGTFPVTSDLGSSVCGDDSASGYSAVLARCLRGRVPDTLFQTLTTYGKLEQVLEALQHHYETEVSEKEREKQLERERGSSQFDHLKSQNDLLMLCLEESKSNCERLSSLIGKYESNNTALSLALQSTDELTEAYEVMLQLQESEQDIFVANCQAAGITNFTNVDTMKSLASTRSSRSNASAASSVNSNFQYHLAYGDDVANYDDDSGNVFRNSAVKRRDAEMHAKLLLQKFDRKYENQITGGASAKSSSQHLWEEDETSYKSRTSTASSANSSTVDELSKEEELKLKDYIQVLKSERNTVETTVTVVEGAQDVVGAIDDCSIDYDDKNRERYIEMETAVLVQELQAKREERAELKHRVYLLEKEKRSLEVRLNAREAQEHAYIVHIEHLKCEVKEQIRKRKQFMSEVSKRYAAASSGSQEEEMFSPNSSAHGFSLALENREDNVSSDSQETSRRENKLRSRIQELVETLEKLTKNSEIRQQQTAEYIADLKRANGALVAAYEKAKKRHASRLKKFEAQLVAMSNRHQEQVAMLKERINTMEGKKPISTETSL